MIADGLARLLDGKRAVGVDLAVTRGESGLGRIHQVGGCFEFGKQAVDGGRQRCVTHFDFTSDSGSSMRISKMEMEGMMRMKM